MLTTSLKEYERGRGEYGDKVRIMCRPASGASCDLVVQTSVPGGWADVRSFNDFSDDYAYTHADRLARSLMKQGVL